MAIYLRVAVFVRDHFHLVFKSAAQNHLRIQKCKNDYEIGTSCNLSFNSYSHLRRYQKKVRIITFSFSSSVATILLAAIFLQVITFNSSQGATFTFGQSSWAGGISGTVAAHPGDTTGWNKYSAKDAELAAGADVKLASTAGSKTHTTDTDFAANNGGTTVQTTDTDFNAGTKTNTAVGGVGSAANVQLAAGTPEPSTKLLVHGDGAGSSFVDSATGKTITAFNALQSTAQSKFGGSSSYFDGNGDYLSIPTSADFAFGTGDFAIDFWALKTANGVNNYDCVISSDISANGLNGFLLELSASRGFVVAAEDGILIQNSTTSGINDGVWHHWAWTRSGSTMQLWKDGVSIASVTNSTNLKADNLIRIGSEGAGTPFTFNGYIDELRVSKGAARWTSNFTPPTNPYGTYTASGTYASTVVNTGAASNFDKFAYTTSTPANTTITVDLRAGNTAVPDGTWTAWQTGVASGADISSFNGKQYMQYRANLVTTDSSATPTLQDISFLYYPSNTTFAQGVNMQTAISGTGAGANVQLKAGGIDSFTKLNIHADGSGSNFTDSSTTGKTVNAIGAATQSTAQSKFGGSSVYFNGSSSLSVPNSSDFDLSASDGTVDFWLYAPSLSGTTLSHTVITQSINGSDSNWGMTIKENGTLNVGKYGVNAFSSSVGSVTAGSWHHIAIVKQGSTTYLYINGDQKNSSNNSIWNASVNALSIGSDGNGGEAFTGYIDEFRFTKGVVRWTANFTPPTGPYANNAANGTYISSSMDTGQKSSFTTLTYNKTTPANTALTVDVRAGNTAAPDGSWTVWQSNVSAGGDISVLNGNRYVQYRANLSTTDLNVTPQLNDITFNDAYFPASADPDSYTKLLIHADGSGSAFTDSATGKAVTAAGAATQSTAQSKFGGSSAYFNGSGSYLNISDSDDFYFGSGDFTIESQAYFTSLTGANMIASQWTPGNAGASAWALWWNGDNNLYFGFSNGSTNTLTGRTWTPTLNTWYHIAAVRTGNVIKLFANGMQIGADIPISVAINNAASTIRIGNDQNADYFSGYLDELRISKGIARWTGNFSAPLGGYSAAYSLTSSSYNTGSTSNVLSKISWTENLPTNTNVQMQVRTSPDNSTWTSWMGPDGTSGSYFTDPAGGETVPAALSNGASDQWIQYKALLSTSDGAATPTLSAVNMQYVVNAPPEIQNVSASQIASGLANEGMVQVAYDVRDSDTDTGITPNKVTTSLEYCTANCASVGGETWAVATDVSGDVGADVAVEQTNWSSGYQILWNAKADYPNQYNITNFKVRVKINDNEGANNVVYGNSNTLAALDTKTPALGSSPIKVDATVSPALVTLSATDDTALQMKVSTDPTLAAASWASYAATKNVSLGASPATVYAQFKDAYGNTSPILSATTPETPGAMMVQDTSNVNTNPVESRLFVAWKVAAVPAPGFASYEIYRSTDQASWSLVGSVTNRLTNYFGDSTVSANQGYYYRVVTKDVDDNLSFWSAVVNGNANGLQDAGEGGGGLGNVPPIISSVTVDQISTTGARINWTTDEISSSTVGFSTSQSSFNSEEGVGSMVTSHSVTLSGLTPDTGYYFQVKSADAGNSLSVDNNGGTGYTFTTAAGDTTAPTISNIGSTNITSSSAEIGWDTDEAADSFVEYSKTDGFTKGAFYGDYALDTSHAVTVPSLEADTTYYFKVHSKDASNNERISAQQSFTTIPSGDVTPPVASAIGANPAFNSAVISWNTDEAATSYVEYGPSVAYGRIYGDNTLTASHSVQLPYDLDQTTTYHYRIHSTDGAGNETVSVDGTFVTTQSPTDATAPTITNLAIGSPTTSSITITWDTNENATSYVGYSLDGNTFAEQGSSLLTAFHSVTLVGLTPDTSYYLKVVSADAAKNTAVDDNGGNYHILSTSQGPQAPTILNITTRNIDYESAEVTWDTNDNANSFVEYGLDTNYGQVAGKYDSSEGHVVALKGLLASTTYHFRVRSADQVEAVSGDYTFMTGQAPDTAAPFINTIATAGVDKNSVTVNWLTNENADSSVYYGETVNYQGVEAKRNDSVTTHSVDIDGLSPATLYHYQIQAKDAAGNVALSADQNFTTLPDTDKPVISNVELQAVSQDSAVITWDTDKEASTEIAFGDTHSLDNNLQTALFGKNHYLKITGLEKGVEYYFQLVSQDVFGNRQVAAEDSFTTLADPDMNHEPLAKIEDISEPPAVLTDTKAVVTFTTDQIAKCFIDFGTQAGSYTEEPAMETLLNKSHSIHLTNLVFSTPYFYKITCEDNLGTIVSADERTFTSLDKQIAQSSVGGNADSSAPLISGISAADVSGESVTIKWETDEKSNSLVAYGTKGSQYSKIMGNYEDNSGPDSYTTSHAVKIDSLVPATDYVYKIISSDIVGNTMNSSEQSFTTSSPTSLSSVRVESQALGQANISWKTSSNTNSIVEYGTSTSYGNKKEQSASTKEHSITISNLEPGSTYHFRVKGEDSSGTLYSSTDNTFEPKSPPKISEVQIGAVTEGSAEVEFVTDVPAEGTVVYINSQNNQDVKSQGGVQLSTKHKIKLVDLEQGVTYNLRIKVRDEQGNENEKEAQSFTTGKDESPPKIDRIKTDSALTQGDRVQSIISWSTNETASTEVFYKEGRSGDEKKAEGSETLTTSHIIVTTNFKPGTVYYFKVKSVDAAGNESVSTDYALLTPKRRENIIQIIIKNFEQIFGWAGV